MIATSSNVMLAGCSALLLGAIALALSMISNRYSGRRPDVLASGIASLAALTLFSYLLYRHGAVLTVGSQLPIPFSLGCDYLSFLVILNTCIVGALALVSSYDYLDIYGGRGYVPYYFCMLVFTYSIALLALVRDWFWFLFLFEIMTLASYFLVCYEYFEREARRIAWNYFVMMHILCSTFLIAGVALIYASTGGATGFNVSLTKFCLPVAILYLIAFATKSGLFPLHFWLPDAHPVAPSPASALLSGCMVEIGVYGYYRILTQLSFIDARIGWLLLAAAFLSTLTGVASYVRQEDMKRLFAWSTIDNMGWMYIILAIPILLGRPSMLGGQVAPLLGLYVLLHGLAKAAAFISSGGVIYSFGTKNIRELRGAYEVSRPVIGSLIASMFALEGVPPFGFFWAKLNVVKLCFAFNAVLGTAYVLLWCLAFIAFLRFIHVMLSGSQGSGLKPKRPVSGCAVASIVSLLAISTFFGIYVP